MSESIANIVELVGKLDKGWHEAVEVARRGNENIPGITAYLIVIKLLL